MTRYIHILFAIFFMFGCGSPNRNEQKSTKQIILEKPKPINISYPDSGTVKKFFDKNWNLVHYKEDAEYYRIANYLNGSIVSGELVKDYYIDGVPQFEGYLISENPDVPNGVTKWFNSDGKLESERNYSNGNLHGKLVDYYPSGNPKLLKYYSNGDLAGNYIEYYDIKNKVKSKGQVKNQKYNGKYQSYYENGNIQLIGNYDYGEKHGIFKSYFENGKLELSSHYQYGKLDGDYIEYYQTGRKKIVGYYSKGEASNTWNYYDEDGDYKKYQYVVYRVGAICNDGTRSSATGRGACSWHGGVSYWLTEYQKTFVSGTGKYKNYNPNNSRYY